MDCMSKTIRQIGNALLCVLLLSSISAHAGPPQHVELTFEIRFGSMQLGVGEDRLRHDGEHYQVYSDTIPKGLAALFIDDIRRESKGSITEEGLRPNNFIERGRKKGIRMAEFDWSNNKLRLTQGEASHVVTLPQGSLDQTSLPYAFAFIKSIPEQISVHVTDGRRIKKYHYRKVGKERIKTVLGELEAIHVERVHDGDDKRSSEFWLALDHHYLPVQVRFTDKKGRAFDSVVTAIRYP